MRKQDKLDIIYEDKELIVINKPSGLLTVATQKEKENTLYYKVSLYLKKKNKNNKVFVVHRLDKDTSGIVLFAKNERLKHLLQDNWDNIIKTREYVALVEGIPKEKNSTIKSWLKETSEYKVYSSYKKNDGKLAITKYEIINRNNKYSLLKIKLLTGRKNQIRVHLSEIGNPIIGDKKYGGKSNPINRLGLHANKLVFFHPITNKLYLYEIDMPREFKNLIKMNNNK